LQLGVVYHWLTNQPGTWSTRNNRNRNIDRIEVMSFIPSLSKDLLLPIMVFGWGLLPDKVQTKFRENGVRRFVATSIGER